MLRPSTAPIGLGLAGLLAVAGCAGATGPARIDYSGPAGALPRIESVTVAQPPDRVFRNLVDRLQQQGRVELTFVDEPGRHLVVEYSGDPEPFVDCGTLTIRTSGRADQVPAAAAETSFRRSTGSIGNQRGETLALYRNLRLDSRMLVQVQPDGGGARVDADAVYVLTKTINVGSRDGDRGQRRETITFGTGESGRFQRSTQCRPTGRLERLAIDSLPEGTVTARPAAPTAPTTSTPVAQDLAAPTPDRVAETAAADPMVTSPLATQPATTSAAEVAPSAPSGPAATAATTTSSGVGTGGTAAATGAAVVGTGVATAMTTAPSRAAPELPPATPPAPVRAASLEATLAELAGPVCGVVDPSVSDAEIRLSGQVGEPADIERLRAGLAPVAGGRRIDTSQLEVVYWPFCAVLEVLAPHADSELAVSTATGSTRLRQGDPLTLEVHLPDDADYLYMGYIQSDGRVGYIATMSVREWAKVGHIRFRTGYEVGPPFGREMVVAVVSKQPLFTDARPAYEPAEEYLKALRQGLARIEGDGSALGAAHLFIVTEAGQGS